MAGSHRRAVFAVLNLSWTCVKKDLRTHFTKYGRVLSVKIPMDMQTGYNKRMGFVELAGPKGFEDMVVEDFHTIDYQEVTVKPRIERRRRPETETASPSPPESASPPPPETASPSPPETSV